MQVFLPYPDAFKSLNCLDPKRLFKQALEGYQICNTLLNKGGWQNHPIVQAFRDNVPYLAAYTKLACNLSKEKFRYKTENISAKLDNLLGEFKIQDNILAMPDWMGGDQIHSSHRSRLLCKGRADCVCDALKSKLKFKKIDDFLLSKNFVLKNKLTYLMVLNLESMAEDLKIELAESYYIKYGWADYPGDGYVWPTNSTCFRKKFLASGP